MSITQGSPLPDVTTTTTATVPDYYNTALGAASNVATGAMGSYVTGADGKPVFRPKTGAEGVAALDPLQQQGYAATSGAASSYIPGITAAQQTAGQAANAMNPNDIMSFMNPYTQSVINEQARAANQNWQRNIMPGLGGQFVGSGGFGGQRFASTLGQAGADFQANLTSQQNKSLSDAYKSALDAAYNRGNLQNQAAQTQGVLAGKEQELGLRGASALTDAGAAQQKYKQSLLDFPIVNAQNAMKIFSGQTIPQGKTVTGPGTKDQYQNSTLQNLTGLSTLIASAGAGKVGDLLFGKAATGTAAATPGLLSKIFSGDRQTVDASQFIGAGADGRGLYYNPATSTYYDSTGTPQGVRFDQDDYSDAFSSTSGYGAEGGAGTVP
jgi:hypothetical protein